MRWRAVCFDHGTLAVRESVYEGRFQPPKTQRARRSRLVRTHWQRSARTASARFAGTPDDLVFGNRNGDPFEPGMEVLQTEILS